MTISGFLYVLLMLALIAALAEHGENRRLRARLEARRIREGYPWDWTRESERKARAALELICDKCHEPRRCSQDELDEACAMCPVPDAVYLLAAGASPSSAPSGHLPPLGEGQLAAEGVGPYKSGREEARR